MFSPDQENWDTLRKFGQNIGYGWANVKLIFVNGLFTGWEEIESRRGHKAPLKKEKEDDES